MASASYSYLDKAWRSTCNVVLGKDIGSLKEYKPWLTEFTDPIRMHKSSIGGSDVVFAINNYCKGAAFASLEEIDFNKKFEPININEVKDMDSIIEAVQERISYTGSVVLGNSKVVSGSTNVMESHFVLDSAFVSDSKYVAYSTYTRYTERVFGCNNDVKSNMVISGLDAGMDIRCLGIYGSYLCSDSYYVSGCEDCRDAIFCFNLVGKNCVIGNLELSREKYTKVKAALVEQMSDELSKKKHLPSIMEIVGKCKEDSHQNQEIFEEVRKKTRSVEATDMKPIEKAFAKTCKVVFGTNLPGNISNYENWLIRNVKDVMEAKSTISGKEVIVGDFAPYNLYPKNRLVRLQEARAAAELLKIDEKDALTLSLMNAHEKLSKIAYFKTESRLRENFNLVKAPVAYNARDCYRGSIYSNVKCSICSHWPRNSEYNAGCSTSFSCSFCINTYFSNLSNRCFEIDSCNSCSDCYYCHNCENLSNCMFCFNVKNLRYAIGNVEVGREKYAKIKKLALDEIVSRLEKKGELGFGIYDLGCWNGKGKD